MLVNRIIMYRIAGNFQRDKFSEISNITEIHSKS